jgi:hypothetical protein
MGDTVIARDTEDDRPELFEFLLVIGKLDGFLGAIGRAVLGVEEQHDMALAAQRGEIEQLHVRIRQAEIRRWLTDL